ncbi:hypothetical protein BpHYR1_050037 [Brachionus plicatilis]|uniref:C-type lectin domain-containing protein n=1 Tax=Brachionus plicatilis TaxID=10195 RepID=A0A3M7R5N3_BRAPC|nr:hypothetical protein BpHYR1_050037 [Brachionus plicatilis]
MFMQNTLCLMMHNSKSFFIRKSVFKKAENLSVFTNLIISKTVRNKFFCLDECNSNNRCTYLKFSNKLCHLYEGFGNNQTGSLLKLYLAKVPQMNLQINCRNSSVYWSLETSNCLLCPNNFIKYDENPYACYHNSFQQLNFTDGKNYCDLKNSFLPSPKTIKEINILLNICGNDYSQIWLDSSISSINETYRWRDGSLVENFEDGEPNNRDGNEINLVETVLAIYFKKIHDFPQNATNHCFTCYLIKYIRKNTATNFVAPFLPKIIFLICNKVCCTLLQMKNPVKPN